MQEPIHSIEIDEGEFKTIEELFFIEIVGKDGEFLPTISRSLAGPVLISCHTKEFALGYIKAFRAAGQKKAIRLVKFTRGEIVYTDGAN